MFRMIVTALLMISCLSFAGTDVDDKKLVKQTIVDAYIKGLQTNRDTVAMKKGFHEGFRMFVQEKDGSVRHVTRDDWADRVDEGKRKNSDRPTPNITHKIPVVEVEGNAAIARIEVYRDGKHIFTDFMSLYKDRAGWKIVGKIFQSHGR